MAEYTVLKVEKEFQVPGIVPERGAPPTTLKTWVVLGPWGNSVMVGRDTTIRLEFYDEEAALDLAAALNLGRERRLKEVVPAPRGAGRARGRQ